MMNVPPFRRPRPPPACGKLGPRPSPPPAPFFKVVIRGLGAVRVGPAARRGGRYGTGRGGPRRPDKEPVAFWPFSGRRLAAGRPPSAPPAGQAAGRHPMRGPRGRAGRQRGGKGRQRGGGGGDRGGGGLPSDSLRKFLAMSLRSPIGFSSAFRRKGGLGSLCTPVYMSNYPLENTCN